MGVVQSKTAARQFANYLKLTKSLAITNSATNNQGYVLMLFPASPYTSYSILDARTKATVKGDAEFHFTALGQLQLGATITAQFTKSTDTSTVTVTPIGRITLQ